MASTIKNWGLKLLGIWLLMESLHHLFNLSFKGFGTVMAILALLAGILIILEK